MLADEEHRHRSVLRDVGAVPVEPVVGDAGDVAGHHDEVGAEVPRRRDQLPVEIDGGDVVVVV